MSRCDCGVPGRFLSRVSRQKLTGDAHLPVEQLFLFTLHSTSRVSHLNNLIPHTGNANCGGPCTVYFEFPGVFVVGRP